MLQNLRFRASQGKDTSVSPCKQLFLRTLRYLLLLWTSSAGDAHMCTSDPCATHMCIYTHTQSNHSACPCTSVSLVNSLSLRGSNLLHPPAVIMEHGDALQKNHRKTDNLVYGFLLLADGLLQRPRHGEACPLFPGGKVFPAHLRSQFTLQWPMTDVRSQ